MKTAILIPLFLCYSTTTPAADIFSRILELDVRKIVYNIEEVDATYVDRLKNWLFREYGTDFDGAIANFGEPFFHGRENENLPLVQHRFTGDLGKYLVMVLVAPDATRLKEGSLVILFDVESFQNCASWVVEPYRAISSVQQILDELWYARTFSRKAKCIGLEDLSIH